MVRLDRIWCRTDIHCNYNVYMPHFVRVTFDFVRVTFDFVRVTFDFVLVTFVHLYIVIAQ